MSIPVFVPALSRVFSPPSDKNNSVGKLLKALWYLEDENVNLHLGVEFPQLSLRSLVSDLRKCYNSDLTSLTAHSLNQLSWIQRTPSAKG
jgi:hypothetical protein